MISETFDFNVTEEFYSLASGEQELELAGKPDLYTAKESETFDFANHNLLDELCRNISVPPLWLTERYDLPAADVTGEANLMSLDALDQVIDFNDSSAASSPSSSSQSFDLGSLSPSPSEEILLHGSINPEESLNPEVQCLFDLINLDQPTNDFNSNVIVEQCQTAPMKLSSDSGPIRTDKTTSKIFSLPYDKPASSGRKSTPKSAEQKSRKKSQNRNAATRYRIKKKDEFSGLFNEATELESKNAVLKEKVNGLTTEIDYLKSLMLDVIKARLSKSQTTAVQANSLVLPNLIQATI